VVTIGLDASFDSGERKVTEKVKLDGAMKKDGSEKRRVGCYAVTTIDYQMWGLKKDFCPVDGKRMHSVGLAGASRMPRPVRGAQRLAKRIRKGVHQSKILRLLHHWNWIQRIQKTPTMG